MTHPDALRTAVAVEHANTLPELTRLLESVVPAEKLPAYTNHDLQGFGTLSDALARVGNDLTAMNDPTYANTMFAAALTRVISAQQEIISELRERVEALDRSSLEASAASPGA